MKVSVIMNSYKESETLFKRAFNSIVADQVIVSTVEGDPCIKWAKGADLQINKKPHIFDQINSAVHKIKHEFVYYCSSNDVMLPNKAIMESKMLNKGKDICYSSFFVVQGNNTTIRCFHPFDYDKLFEGCYITDCALIRSEIFKKYTPLKTEFGNDAFYDFWFRVYKGEGDVFVYNPNPTWEYHITGDSQHMKRKKDPAAMAKKMADRKRMLNTHR